MSLQQQTRDINNNALIVYEI